MSIKKQIINKNKYFIFVSLVAIICLLGGIFGVTYAYITGHFKDDSSSSLPFVKSDIYYNTTKLTGSQTTPSITGSVSEAGVVSLSVGGTTLTANAGGTISLPLYIKNSGNVDAELLSLSVVFEFSDAEGNSLSNSTSTGGYHLALVAPTSGAYEILENTFFTYDSMELTKNSDNSSQFLTSVTISSDIASSELCGCTFTIFVMAEVGQIGISDL